jgi:two-component system sensor histidine kinase DesK
VFWAPYQHDAAALEWTVTALTHAAVLALFLAGLTYDENRKVAAGICAALLLVSSGFMAYRPAGGIYFGVAVAFVPIALGGRMAPSLGLVAAVTALFGIQWRVLYPSGAEGALFPWVVGLEILLSGIGVTFFVCHAREKQRRDKAVERERIARDLHDVLGHSLSGLALKAELARRVLHTDPVRALAEIGDVERIARQALEDMRGAIQGYHVGDIYAELDRVEALLKAADVNVERRCEQLVMSPAMERVLALIVREAVTNVLRHSQAQACRLSLFRDDGAYRLEISDNGRGGAHREGVGMHSIRTRAEALGGTAVWSSAVGTQLCVTLPVSAPEGA